jgi:hypothetical protein
VAVVEVFEDVPLLPLHRPTLAVEEEEDRSRQNQREADAKP